MYTTRSFIAAVLLAGSAYAQSTSVTTTISSTSTLTAATAGTTVHVVKVSNANADLVFSPNTLQANPGDMVQWQFYPKNHSVVMASFAQPCVPIQQSDPANAANAFFSGFMPVSTPADGGRLTYTIMVKDTKPIWYYCSQAKHCEAGMVGVINPPANSANTIEAFAANAKNAPNNVTPSGSGTSGSGTSETSSSSTSGTTTSTSAVAQSTGAATALRDAASQGLLGTVAAGLVAWLLL